MEEKLLKIYKYGEEVLQMRAQEVQNLDGKIARLIRDMVFTIHSNRNAIGLAAPQVGESVRISVIDFSLGENDDHSIILINPEILEAAGKNTLEEGCLSFPGINVPINRSSRILLKNYDLNGKETHQEIDGFLARVIQHEIDHLDGTLIIDRISSLKRQFLKKEIRLMQRDGEW